MANKLTIRSEVMFRQIHPNYLQGGEPTSDRFRPTALDNDLLSVDRSSITSAEMAHALCTSTGRRSAAVFGLSVGEFHNESVTCIEDPIACTHDTPANAAHALAEFTVHDQKKQKVIAKRLKSLAIKRGCFHPSQLADRLAT